MTGYLSPRHAESAACNLIKKVIDKFDILPRHADVLVGLSGGVDSIVLLEILHRYNEKFTRDWSLRGVHIHPGFPGWRITNLERFLKKRKYEYEVITAPIQAKLETVDKNPCFFCARQRRRALVEYAEARAINTVAVAHHREDVAETLLLNLCFSRRFSTMVPKQSILQGRFFLIRPLYFFDKQQIADFARLNNLPVIHNNCPYAKSSTREEVRRLLKRLSRKDPRVIDNIFHGINNVKTAYLP